LTPPRSADPRIRSTRIPGLAKPATVFTIGHGTRSAEELIACLAQAGVGTLVDVRRFPSSRRHPQFNRGEVEETLAAVGIGYRHAVELGGRRSGEPGEERFACIESRGFRSYVARMGQPAWQTALDAALAERAPCFMCAETLWWRCHRRFIAELLTARGHEVLHLIGPGQSQGHRLLPTAEVQEGRLYLCGALVA
jgi:uncharacterized protein (DUF488 family)